AVAEWYSRDVTSLAEMGLAPRVAFATTAPFLYAWRTIWPTRLSPLYVLPLSPKTELLPLVLGIGAVTAITAFAWTRRRRQPTILAAWIAYVILLAPVAGLTPTGVQASADRYMYVPSVVIAIAVGLGLARVRMHGHMRALVALATAGALTLLALLTRSQTRYWKDSIAVWSRAAAIDPRNHGATYNLRVAPADARPD